MSAEPTPITAAFGLEPTFSAREAAVLLGRSYSWLDQRLRKNQFVRPDGTVVTNGRGLPTVHDRDGQGHRYKQLQAALVFSGEGQVHVLRASYGRRDRVDHEIPS
jgi:hypothetical protein